MKKFFFFIFSVVFINFMIADQCPTIEVWKMFKMVDKCILIDQNNDLWELNALNPNKQSWKEWFYRIPALQPDPCFFFEPTTWKEKTVLQVIPCFFENSDVYRMYNNPSEDLKKCTYILEHPETKNRMFARPITVDQFCKDLNDLHTHHYVSEKLFKSDFYELNQQILEILTFILLLEAHELHKLQDNSYSTKYIEFNQKHDFLEKTRNCISSL